MTRSGDTVVYEETGGFIDMVGFAYLRDGPARLRAEHPGEVPHVDHLGGDWCTSSVGW